MMEKKKNRRWKQWLNYQSIVEQIPFFLFLTALAVVYIYNGHHADKTIRNIGRATNELKDMQGEYKSVTGDALLHSRQSEMIEAVKPLGLKELAEQPVVLIDSSR